jgi:hypothetical protein
VGLLPAASGRFNGGTVTGAVSIAPTTYAPIGSLLQLVGKDAVPAGANLLQAQDHNGNDILDVDDIGDLTLTAKSGAGIFLFGQGVGEIAELSNNAGSLRVLFKGLPTADPSVTGRLWVDVAAGRVLKVSA